MEPKGRGPAIFAQSKPITMKNRILSYLMVISAVVLFNGCSQDDAAYTVNDIVGTYVGPMNVSNPSFTNALYTVTVTKVSGTTVRITPSSSAASTWDAPLINISGTFTCTNCIQQQVTFTYQSNRWVVAYNYGSNNEQFSGTKQ
jgi:hypothetical protein